MTAGGHGEKLSRKREQAIAALLTEPTVTAAARAVGVGERTLRRWMHEAGFRDAYAAARRELGEAALDEARRGAGDAVRFLRTTVGNTEARTRDRIAAAVALARLGAQAHVLDEERVLVREVRDLAESVARGDELPLRRFVVNVDSRTGLPVCREVKQAAAAIAERAGANEREEPRVEFTVRVAGGEMGVVPPMKRLPVASDYEDQLQEMFRKLDEDRARPDYERRPT